jgi:hypothetical protein
MEEKLFNLISIPLTIAAAFTAIGYLARLENWIRYRKSEFRRGGMTFKEYREMVNSGP